MTLADFFDLCGTVALLAVAYLFGRWTTRAYLSWQSLRPWCKGCLFSGITSCWDCWKAEQNRTKQRTGV